jgi:hypothetical protein
MPRVSIDTDKDHLVTPTHSVAPFYPAAKTQ